MLNNKIVEQFLKNMYKKSDFDKILKEAEFGFEKKNALDFGVKIGEKIGKYFNMLTGKDIKDMEFELDKGYFNEIYNYNSKIKNPTVDDVKIFKKSLSNRVKEVCEEIESIINNKIDKVKNKITKEEIQKLFNDI